MNVKCCERASPSKCTEKCTKKLPCNHICDRRCRDPCSTICKAEVQITEPGPCNHIFSIPCYEYCQLDELCDEEIVINCHEPCNIVLKCKHVCKGNCYSCFRGRFHIDCNESCDAVFVCGHKCDTPCFIGCRPCSKPCEVKCQHSRCDKKCGEPCVPCREKCELGCKHKRCTKLCFEECDIKPCLEACDVILKCNHPCIGFCGDPCPPLCRICDEDQFKDVVGVENDSRFVLLPDCGHCVENKEFLKLVTERSEPKEIFMKSCPKCKTHILNCSRLTMLIKQDLMDITSIKRKIYFGDKENDVKSIQNKYFNSIRSLKNQPIVQEYLKLKNYFENFDKKNSMKNEGTLNVYELDVFKNILDVLGDIFNTYEAALIDTYPDINQSVIDDQISRLITALPDTLYVSAQRLEDLQLELRRFKLMVDVCNNFPYKSIFDVQGDGEYDIVRNKLDGIQRFTENIEKQVLKLIKVPKIFEIQRRTVNLMELKTGRWFRCPDGHLYVIHDNDESADPRKCVECQAIKDSVI